MIGKTLGQYRIEEKLGAGGMGEVYRAHDERLDRDVAMKVLPAKMLTDEVARKRFRKEALALSKLNHPNIATIYDFDTQDGVDFLVMEYVEGTTLSEKLSNGPLPEEKVTKLGRQVADALEEAHEHGVIHRDLKPGNVMVTPKDHAKVLDFGLAKLVRPVSETAVTESLTEGPRVAGTLPYMAPEQLQGEEVDARTDIHALGLLLYEMSTGRRAFREELATRLADAILHRAPVTPRGNKRQSLAGPGTNHLEVPGERPGEPLPGGQRGDGGPPAAAKLDSIVSGGSSGSRPNDSTKGGACGRYWIGGVGRSPYRLEQGTHRRVAWGRCKHGSD